jgi:hypothetical protein
MKPDAFIDYGYSELPKNLFAEKFLESPDFTVQLLRQINGKKGSSENKEKIAKLIAEKISQKILDPEEVMLNYLAKPRGWLSFKTGKYSLLPERKSVDLLLEEFGDSDWYGPLYSSDGLSVWYARVQEIQNLAYLGIDAARTLDTKQRIRWIVAAELRNNYVALHWDGFSYGVGTERLRQAQFPYWWYIPKYFQELSNMTQSNWEDPNFTELVLKKLWGKYHKQKQNGIAYNWRHLRIRAEASGVALNARSAGTAEIDISGLQALSRELAKSAIQAIGEDKIQGIEFSTVEDSILRTIIHEWGTKSYEFCLDETPIEAHSSSEKINNNLRYKKLIKSHCYFGAKPEPASPDSFAHFKCYHDYGGSTSALNFLIRELDC